MASKPKHICAALQDKPEIAQKIGLLVADYAVLDWLLFHQFAMLSHLRPEEVFQTYFSQRSLDRKTELIENEAWRLSPQLDATQKRLLRRMKGAARRRTEIAHAHLMNGASGPMRLLLYGDRVQIRPFDEQFVRQTINQFHTLAADLSAFGALLLVLGEEILVPRLEAVYAPINKQLQRTPAPRRPATQTEASDLEERCIRIGIDLNVPHQLQLWVEKETAHPL